MNKIKAAVFDFDGTISTLRAGWEKVMEPLMAEMIYKDLKPTKEQTEEILEFIDESTGIQTIYQMKWLNEKVKEVGINKNLPDDPWWYKEQYNVRLMESVSKKRCDILSGKTDRNHYLVAGAEEFLKKLKRNHVKMYLASGTDDADVRKEAEILGVAHYFEEICGAQPMKETCSKEAVIIQLIEKSGVLPEEILVCGDGPVEIRLGSERKTKTLAVASDEEKLRGINEIKLKRLRSVNPEKIVGDFLGLTLSDLTDKNIIGGKRITTKYVKTNCINDRHNLVTTKNIFTPGKDGVDEYNEENFEKLIDAIIEARKNKRPVILSMGAHVIKNGLSRYLIELARKGLITHLAGNGAGSIHDFELAYSGGTSEDVKTAIEDGSFGMWEETGYLMNTALQQGAKKDMGYGESLGAFIDENQEKFPYKEDCVVYQLYKMNIPATYHIALGTDIIHQHPIVDFGAIGVTSGNDFKKYCYSISKLEGGVFLNFGSGVIGPEVFLKALSISRNLGYETFHITTANFDLINLGDYRSDISSKDPLYYYRPRKNIVNRPVSRGGNGYHFIGDHKITIPNLYNKLVKKCEEDGFGVAE